MDSSESTAKENTIKSPIWRDKLLLTLMTIAVIGVVLQITLGGVVRVTGSGDGCPDWPMCFGQAFPPLDQETIDRLYDGPRLSPPQPHNVLIEFSHRTVGTLVGLIIVATVILVWTRHSAYKVVAWLATAEFIVITIVGGLGGAVVLSDLNPAIRTVHLFLAEIVVFFAVMALVAASYGRPSSIVGTTSKWMWGRVSHEHRSALILSATAGIVTLIALLSGSYAVWKEAGAVCPSWPLCGGDIIPQSTFEWIHMTHRVLSLVSIILVLLAGHKVWRLPNISGALRFAALASAVIIFSQMLMGAANPWTTFAEWARAGHLSLATLAWVDMVFIVALLLRPVPGRELAEASRSSAE
ncbi:MAG: COX15/CtaA family protein [Chloroflexi bacterium]|nr:COX15/CtaA family protein [Chloroflexota bacterium]MDA1283252.1 COX15/CtaA family protein [Chloroflexota bacterium]